MSETYLPFCFHIRCQNCESTITTELVQAFNKLKWLITKGWDYVWLKGFMCPSCNEKIEVK